MNTYMFAVRDRFDGAIHSTRYENLDDAMSAAEELAYEMEMDISEFEVVELVERVNSSIKVTV